MALVHARSVADGALSLLPLVIRNTNLSPYLKKVLRSGMYGLFCTRAVAPTAKF